MAVAHFRSDTLTEIRTPRCRTSLRGVAASLGVDTLRDARQAVEKLWEMCCKGHCRQTGSLTVG